MQNMKNVINEIKRNNIPIHTINRDPFSLTKACDHGVGGVFVQDKLPRAFSVRYFVHENTNTFFALRNVCNL